MATEEPARAAAVWGRASALRRTADAMRVRSVFDMPLDDLRERAEVLQRMIEVVRESVPVLSVELPSHAGEFEVSELRCEQEQVQKLLRACFDRVPQILPGLHRVTPAGAPRPDRPVHLAIDPDGPHAPHAPREAPPWFERDEILARVSSIIRELVSGLDRARQVLQPALAELPLRARR